MGENKKHVYLYKGVAYQQVYLREGVDLVPYAFNNEGEPVVFTEYATAYSAKQAHGYISRRIEERYGNQYKVVLLADNFYKEIEDK